jgi:hypothetical protein
MYSPRIAIPSELRAPKKQAVMTVEVQPGIA